VFIIKLKIYYNYYNKWLVNRSVGLDMKEYQEKNVDKSVVVVKNLKVRVNENEKEKKDLEVIAYLLEKNLKDEDLKRVK
jgi:hypothetical protein